MNDAMKACPRFQKCNSNICTLDSEAYLRVSLPDEEKCGMEKSVRQRIGTKYKLPKLGLTNSEFSAFQNWNKKTEKEKDEIKNRLVKTQFQSKSKINPEAFFIKSSASLRNEMENEYQYTSGQKIRG